LILLSLRKEFWKLNPSSPLQKGWMPERPPIQVKKNDKYVIEGYDKKMNVKSRTIIRMGGVNPAQHFSEKVLGGQNDRFF